METSIETKMPFYNFVNIFLPGIAFIGICILLFFDNIKDQVTSITHLGSTGIEILISVACFAIAYEVGYILFRLGAIAVEPLLKKLFGWTQYDMFVAAKKAGANSLDMLSREYGYARTQIILFLSLSVLMAVKSQWIILGVCLLCVVIFILTARGHIKKIAITVEKYTSDKICSNAD